MRLPRRAPYPGRRAVVAFAAGEACILAGGLAHPLPGVDRADSIDLEAWTGIMKAASTHGARGSIVVSLHAAAAPLAAVRERPAESGWAERTASEILAEQEAVLLKGQARHGPWWVFATPRNLVRTILQASQAARAPVEAIEPSALSLLRLAPARGPATVLVAAVSDSACEIAAGVSGAPLLARSVAVKRHPDAAAEIEASVRYLQRAGYEQAAVVLCGPAADGVASALRHLGIETADIIPAGSAAEAVASSAARRHRQDPDFQRAILGRAAQGPRAAAVAAAALLVASVSYALSTQSTVGSLRVELGSLQATHQTLQARLSRWKGPRAQAAAAALASLELRKADLDVLRDLQSIVPQDAWLEKVDLQAAGAVRLEGHSLSLKSVLDLAAAAASIWRQASVRSIEHAGEPMPSYRFVLEAHTGHRSGGQPR